MTLHFPDVSNYQAGISFAGAPVAMVKATEGTGYVNPDYVAAKARAKAAGAFLCAYHFLHAGNGAGQADHAHAIAGATPLMLDMELEGASKPGVADAVAFIGRYRALGGTCWLLYLPRWYWQQIGSPSLKPLTDLGMLLVSSQYTTYSDAGPGWAAYGGMTPAIWQYTDKAAFNGHSVDFNAYRGTLPEFISLVTTGRKAPVQQPPPPPAMLPAPASVSVTPHRAVNASWAVVTHAGQPVARYRAEMAKGTPDHPILPAFYSELIGGTHLPPLTVIPEGPVVIRVKAAADGIDGAFTPWKAVP